MSKSLKRVQAALAQAGVDTKILQMEAPTRTAQDAAVAIGCDVDQIAKSIIFQGRDTGQLYLFITAGRNQVDPDKAKALTGEPLERADAATIRKVTGFAIGGVSPIGHVTPITAFVDPKLDEFDDIYAAAGTPHHIFQSKLLEIQNISSAQITDFTS